MVAKPSDLGADYTAGLIKQIDAAIHGAAPSERCVLVELACSGDVAAVLAEMYQAVGWRVVLDPTGPGRVSMSLERGRRTVA